MNSMNKDQKREVAEEVLKNMSITKEQYIELCKLCDDFDLEKTELHQQQQEEPSWDDILKQAN